MTLVHLGRGHDVLVAGDDLEIRVGLVDADGSAVDLGDLGVTAAKLGVSSQTGEVLALTLNAGITIDTARNEIIARFANRMTENLVGVYDIELEIVSVSRGVITPIVGTITFVRSRLTAS